MSAHLIWRPVKPQTETNLGQAASMRFVLKNRWGLPVVLSWRNSEHVRFLEGMAAWDCEEAGSLLKAMQEHGEISVEEQY